MKTIEKFANEGGMIPEQIWDEEDIPERELFFGKPAGSAMPLAWAHAEYAKLIRSLNEEEIFDMPPYGHKRYIEDKTASKISVWRFNNKCRSMEKGKTLRIETLAKAVVRWSTDDWETENERSTKESGLGIYYADIPTSKLKKGAKIRFTFFWPGSNESEGTNFTIEII